MADDPEEGFLARWSRRKRTPEQEEEFEEPAVDEAAAEPEAELEAAEPEIDEEAEENRRVAEGVDIDSLTYEDDFKIFMKRGVPGPLRQKALRKLWRTNPVLANLDGLNDYEEDFNDPKMKVYNSIWKTGRGFLSELEVKAQQGFGRISAAYEDPDEDADAVETTEVFPPVEEEVAEVSEEAPQEAVVMDAAEDEPEFVEVTALDDEENVEEPAAPKRVSLRKRWQV